MTETIKTFNWNSLPVRIVSTFIIIVLLMLPMKRIEHLIDERESSSAYASEDIYKSWSKPQLVSGPYLVVPYWNPAADTEDSKIAHFVLTPDRLQVDGKVVPIEKKRGIFKTIVYQSELKFSGSFDTIDTAPLKELSPVLSYTTIYWDQAQLRMDIADLKGLSSEVLVNWNGREIPAKSFNSSHHNNINGGFKAPINFNAHDSAKFSFTLDLKGSKELMFLPSAQSSQIALQSTWASPKFKGAHSPKSEIASEGFTAQWYLSSFNRPILPMAKGSRLAANVDSAFGVELIEPVNGYVKAMRATKYALFFIVLTFVGLFFVEIFTKKESNLLQYLLTGGALVLFYSLLVSLSEHVSFDVAYLISSIAIIALISLYAHSLSKNFKTTFVLLALWSGLYTYLFFILQMEDYAFLAGNIGLFVILAIIMFTSRKLKLRSNKKEELPKIDNGDLL